jgi:hypothetical protein
LYKSLVFFHGIEHFSPRERGYFGKSRHKDFQGFYSFSLGHGLNPQWSIRESSGKIVPR